MTLNTYLKWIAITAVFSVLVIPLIVSNSLFFPFITGKAFFFRIATEIGFASWLLLAFRDPASRPRKSLVLWSFVAFLAVIGVADIFGVNPWKSFWSNFERMEGYITLVHLFMYFVMASAVLAAEKTWRTFMEASLWLSALVSSYGLLQILGKATINQGGVRVDSTFGNATYLAIYLVFNIFFVLIVSFREGSMWKKIVYPLIGALHLVILYHTATRGAILGLIGGVLLTALLIALFDRKEKRIRMVSISVIGAVALVVLGFMAVKNASFVTQSPVLQRFASISWNETKTQARSYIWPMAIKGWEEKPILGWGQENFNYIFNKYYDPRMYSQEQWFDHAHNSLLDWLVAGGILGLLAYLSLFASAGYLLWKKTDLSFTEKSLWTGLGAAYFFNNLFVFDNLMSYVLFVSLLAFIHFKATRLEKPILVDAEEVEGKMAGPVLLIVLAFSIYFFNGRAYETNTHLIGALRDLAAPPAQVEAAIGDFQKSLSYDTLGRPEVVERVVEASKTVNSPSVSIDLRQKFFDMAQKATEDQTKRFAGDARYEVFAGAFYSYFGLDSLSIQHFEKAASLSPKKQTILFQLGREYIAAKKFDEALKVFKEAYDLEPAYDEAAANYATALIYAGRESEAAAFVKQSGRDLENSDAFITAYADLGKWDKVIPILQSRIAADPKNLQLRMNLVAAYYQSGKKAMAVSTLQDMIATDPSFKAQGEQLIQQIQVNK